MRSIAAMALSIFVCGCVGPLVPVADVNEETALELARHIHTYEAAEMPPQTKILAPLSATSCQNKIWDKIASRDDAIAQLRLQARARGANAVGNLVCEEPKGTDLAKNCWNSVTCTGSAIIVGAREASGRRP